MGLGNLSEKCYSLVLVNEFFSRLLTHANEYENPIRFRSNMLYMFFDGQERYLGKLLSHEHYDGRYETPSPYLVESV